jgi:hypothetical protein
MVEKNRVVEGYRQGLLSPPCMIARLPTLTLGFSN